MNTLAIVAAESAYNECEDWLDALLDYIDGTQDLVEAFVQSHLPEVKAVKPEGTYLSWLDVRSALDKIGATTTAATSSEETPEEVFQRFLVDHARIHINPGSSYGLGGAGHMRMNIATSRQLVEAALTNMASALASA